MKSTIKKSIYSGVMAFSLIMLISFTSKNSETIVVKTNIYCDHCKVCSSCGGKIIKDLGFSKGIQLVELDEVKMTITITYNPKKTSPEAIRQAISMYGYDADSVKADSAAYSRLDECCHKK